MTEAILFPDVEALLVSYLEPLVNVPVTTKVPKSRPASFVRVTRVGGPRRDLITDQAMVVVEAWAASTTDASDLAALARAHVFALAQREVNGEWVRAVRDIAGPQDYPDPITDTPRYQFTVQLDVRGNPLP